MTTSQLPGRLHRSISKEEATQQFDLLFDEYFLLTQTRAPAFAAVRGGGVGEDQLEAPGSSAEEVDEVCTDSHTDPQQKDIICEVARELAKLGDCYSKKFGDVAYQKVEPVLTQLFAQASELEYQTFQNTLESLMNHDKNAANFMFMMCLSSKIVNNVGRYADKAKSYFRRYIGTNYIPAVADAGGVREYMGEPES